MGLHWAENAGGLPPVDFYLIYIQRLLGCKPPEKPGIHMKALSGLSAATGLHYSVFTRQPFFRKNESGSRYLITEIEPMLDYLVEVGTYTREECDMILAKHTLELAGG